MPSNISRLKRDGALYLLRCKPSPIHHEVHVNAGKHLRIPLRALGFKFDDDILNRLAALLEDMNHIVPRTAPEPDQHQFHGTWSRTTSLRPESRSKHNLVPAPGLADERAVFNPFYPCLHQRRPSATGVLPRASLTVSTPPLARLAENWHRPSTKREKAGRPLWTSRT